ncbi:MAG: hypothetical protein H6Q70_1305 [Firmicutes bacterium]|nr:hypothetical protein [Bacillota bacterium]
MNQIAAARPSLLALIAQYELLISLEKEKRKKLSEEYPDSCNDRREKKRDR